MQLVVVQVSGKEAGGHGVAPRGSGPGNEVGSALAEGRACLAAGLSAGAPRGQRRLGGPGSSSCRGQGGTLDAPRAHPSPTLRPPQEGTHPRGEPSRPRCPPPDDDLKEGAADGQHIGPQSPEPKWTPHCGATGTGVPKKSQASFTLRSRALEDVHGAVTTRHPARLSSRDMPTSDRNVPSQLE